MECHGHYFYGGYENTDASNQVMIEYDVSEWDNVNSFVVHGQIWDLDGLSSDDAWVVRVFSETLGVLNLLYRNAFVGESTDHKIHQCPGSNQDHLDGYRDIMIMVDSYT